MCRFRKMHERIEFEMNKAKANLSMPDFYYRIKGSMNNEDLDIVVFLHIELLIIICYDVNRTNPGTSPIDSRIVCLILSKKYLCMIRDSFSKSQISFAYPTS